MADSPKFLRLGAASVMISISDADGFRVVHGTDKVTLRHVPADDVPDGTWDRLWEVIDQIAPVTA